MGKKGQKKDDWRAGFEAMLSRTAIGREYLEEVEEAASDLPANTGRSNPSKERQDAKDRKEATQETTNGDTSTTS